MDGDGFSDLARGSDLTYRIIGLAMRVHRRLGPGLLESVYETCLCYELKPDKIPFLRQVNLPVVYDEVYLECAYVADIIVAHQVVLEIKSVEAVLPVRRNC
jgi:GxxExxY protein